MISCRIRARIERLRDFSGRLWSATRLGAQTACGEDDSGSPDSDDDDDNDDNNDDADSDTDADSDSDQAENAELVGVYWQTLKGAAYTVAQSSEELDGQLDVPAELAALNN